MIDDKDIKRISKALSYVLRHHPESIDIELDKQGWTDVDILISQLNTHNLPIDRELLNHVVETNSKKRFAFSSNGQQIRASQGHSVAIDLGYTPQVPPDILFHGTSEKYIESILSTGLEKRERQHVHLSQDQQTAIQVGGRHGKPVVLIIEAAQMQTAGYLFYLSENNVWLTDHVPVQYINLETKS